MVTFAVLNAGSTSGKGNLSNLKLIFVSTVAEAVNVIDPPLGKLNGYRSAFSFANPAHPSAPVGNV